MKMHGVAKIEVCPGTAGATMVTFFNGSYACSCGIPSRRMLPMIPNLRDMDWRAFHESNQWGR